MGDSLYIVIGHDPSDEAMAAELCAALEAAGMRCWIASRDMTPAASWVNAISHAVKDSRAIVMLHTTRAVRSDLLREQAIMASRYRVPVVILLQLDDTPPAPELQRLFTNLGLGSIVHWIDAIGDTAEGQAAKVAACVERFASRYDTEVNCSAQPRGSGSFMRVLTDAIHSKLSAMRWSRMNPSGERSGTRPLQTRERAARGSSEIKRASRRDAEDLGSPPQSATRIAGGDFDESDVGDVVECTAYAPAGCRGGSPFLVQVGIHMPAAADHMSKRAREHDPSAGRRGATALATRVQRDTRLAFRLKVTGGTADEERQDFVWLGKHGFVQFLVTPLAAQSTVGLTISVLQSNVPIGTIKFVVAIQPSAVESTPEAVGDAVRYRTAFASYASQDRAEVLRRVQMLRAVGIRCFQDVLDLEPGELWERQLWKRIDEADVLFLFWSRHALSSDWVAREWRHGLQHKGLDFIRPVILEHPPVPPPEELAALHFDDVIARCLA